MNLNVMYCVDDISKMFRLGRTQTYKLVNSKGFPAIRLNNKILVPGDKLEIWIEKQCGKLYRF